MDEVQRTVRLGEAPSLSGFHHDIVFQDLSLIVKDTSAMQEEYKKMGWKRYVPFVNRPVVEKEVLKDVSGVFRFKRFTAIMGASGAGKTSLLTQIAGQLPKDSKTSGKLFIGRHPLDYSEIKAISGFVFQDDVILSTMTVDEALGMSAKLRLPPNVDREQRIEEMIDAVALKKARRTQIGQPGGHKGISGGERKRTSTQR